MTPPLTAQGWRASGSPTVLWVVWQPMLGGGGVETRVNALAIRGSPNKSASGRTNQILSYMVFGFTRCKIVYSSQTGRMREQTVGLP